MSQETIHHPERNCFELASGASEPAHITYELDGNIATFDHTYVPNDLRGKGIAGIMTKSALDQARALNWKIIPECSYIATYIRRHPEYADLLAS